MFKINKHRFNNYIFSIIVLILDEDFDFFIIIDFSKKKTLSRPYAKPPVTLIWVAI
jgi:hypothetical protein